MTDELVKRALVVGSSRGLGLVLVKALLSRNWSVTATTRRAGGELADLVASSGDLLTVESLDMTSLAQLLALGERMTDASLDLLFVNAGIDRGDVVIEEVDTDTFAEVMITNSLGPLRALAALRSSVKPGGVVAVMSSKQGSISLNTEDGYELYKASKAALNQLMRSYATRHHDDGHTKLLIDPGHNRTRLGGMDAPLAPEETIPAVVDVLESCAGTAGLQFLDRHGQTVPW